jgi:hypothetical protein
MAQWFVAYCPSLDWAYDDPSVQCEIPRYRVHSSDDPERWVVETNADLPPAVQEDIALLIADRLSKIFEN